MKKIVFAVLLLAVSLSYGQTYISLRDKHTYDMLENLNARNKINIKFIGVKPYKVQDVYKLIAPLKGEDERLNFFIANYKQKYIIRNDYFLSEDSKNVKWFAEPYGSYAFATQRDEGNTYNDIGDNVVDFGARGGINYRGVVDLYNDTNIKFNMDGELFREELSPTNNFTNKSFHEYRSEDQTETVLSFVHKNFDAAFGKFPLSGGAGYLNSLTLSEQQNYYEAMNLNVWYKDVKFSTITGSLTPDSQTEEEGADSTMITNGNDRTRKVRQEKYLSFHRLEWRVNNQLSLGINETVISGGRSLEFGYLLPVMPLRWMEHYYKDRDNATMSFDFYYKTGIGINLYGELFVDDETHEESFTEFYGNKWALLSGLYYADFLTIPYLNLRFECSRIEPYVYTHWKHINRFMNSDEYLGGSLGPDSESYNIVLDYLVTPDLQLKLCYLRGNVGEPIWGYWDAPLYSEMKKVFLRGTVEKHYLYAVECDYRINDFLTLDLFYSHLDIINYNHNLPDNFWYEYDDIEVEPQKRKRIVSDNSFKLQLNITVKNLKKLGLNNLL